MEILKRMAYAVAVFAMVLLCTDPLYAARQTALGSVNTDPTRGCFVLANVEAAKSDSAAGEYIFVNAETSERDSAKQCIKQKYVEAAKAESAQGSFVLAQAESVKSDAGEVVFAPENKASQTRISLLQKIKRKSDRILGKLSAYREERKNRNALQAVQSEKIEDIPEIEEVYDESAEEFDLILNLRRSREFLSRTLVGIQKGPRNFVPMLEIARLVDFPADADLSGGRVNGFFYADDNTYSLDVQNGTYSVRGETFQIPEGHVLTRDFGQGLGEIYVTPELLNQIWSLRVRLDFAEMTLRIETPFLLPYEQARARKEQHDILQNAGKDELEELDFKFIPNDYKLIGKPAARITGVTRYDTKKSSLDQITSIKGAGGLLWASADYNAQIKYDDTDGYDLTDLRLRLTRRADRGNELPFGVKLLQLGDISTKPSVLITRNANGRGLNFTNKSFRRPQTFDRITIEGTGQPGWEVELYRGSQLLNFGIIGENGEYRFTDVALNFGKNKMRIVLYGPQGQIEEREESYNISNVMLSPSEMVIEGTVLDANERLIAVEDRGEGSTDGLFQTLSIKKGFNAWLTPFGTITSMQTEEGKQTYLTAGANFSALGGFGTVEAYKQINGGRALDTRLSTKFAGINFNLSTSFLKDFESVEVGFGTLSRTFEGRINASKAFKLPFGNAGLDLGLTETRYESDTKSTSIDSSQSLAVKNLRFSNQISTSLTDNEHRSTSGRFSASATLSKFLSARSFAGYEVYPESDLQNTRFELRYRDRENFSASTDASHNFQSDTSRIGVDASYDFGTFLGGAGADWDIGKGFNFVLHSSTSLGPFGENGSYIASSKSLTGKSALGAHIFFDKNLDGKFNAGDEPLQGAQVFINGLRSDPADSEGYIRDLTPGSSGLVKITLDHKSLDNEFFVSDHEGYYTILRPVTEPFIEIPVIETGAIDGVVRFADGNPARNLRVQLVNAHNRVVAETATDFDGFYNFEFVKPGDYIVQADPTHEFSVPPVSVRVASNDLFRFGTDLHVMEQAMEAKANGADEAQGERGIVPKLHDLLALWAERLAPSPSGSRESAAVNRVRIGEHPGKVRLVLDLSGPVDYEVLPSHDGRAVTLHLYETGWHAQPSWRGIKVPIVKAMEAKALKTGGTALTIEAKGRMSVFSHGLLEPRNGGGYRLYIDLVSSDTAIK